MSHPAIHRFLTGGAIAALIVMVASFFLIGRGHGGVANAAATPPPVVTVSTEKVIWIKMPRQLVVTGSISAWDPLSIGAAANGLRIDKTPVEEGDVVRKGQVLCELDNSVLKAQLAAMQAHLQQMEATLSKTRQPNRPQDIAGLEAAELQARANLEQEQATLIQAHANLVNAETNERRYQNLVGQGYVTEQEKDDRITAAQSARASYKAEQDRVRAMQFALEQSRQKLSLGRAGGMRQDIDAAGASSAETRANIQQLQALIELTYVRAPDDGLIIRRDAHIGDITSTGKNLFTMVRANQLELRAQIAELDLPSLKVGQAVDIQCGNVRLVGHIWLVSPQVDTGTRLGTARILIPNHRGVMTGMFVRGVISLGAQPAMVVPSAAVQGQMDRYYVYLYDNGRARRRTIVTGTRNGQSVQVTEGLRVGDEIIVAGAGFLTDGDAVRLQETATRDAKVDAKS